MRATEQQEVTAKMPGEWSVKVEKGFIGVIDDRGETVLRLPPDLSTGAVIDIAWLYFNQRRAGDYGR